MKKMKKIVLILSVLTYVVLLSGCKGDNTTTTTTHIKGKIISIETCRYTKRIIVENDNQRFYINDDFWSDSTSEDFKLCIIGDSIECNIYKGNYTDENFKILN